MLPRGQNSREEEQRLVPQIVSFKRTHYPIVGPFRGSIRELSPCPAPDKLAQIDAHYLALNSVQVAPFRAKLGGLSKLEKAKITGNQSVGP